MSKIEFIVEVYGGFFESVGHTLMHKQSSSYNGVSLFLHGWFEFFELTVQEGNINDRKWFVIGERNRYGPEMSLKSGVYEERPGGGVHWRD